MKALRWLTLSLLAATLMGLLPGPSWAVPPFARKYGFDCTMCHVQYPKLNDFGQSYRDNGYRIMGKETLDKTVLETAPPIAMRTSVGYNHDTFDNPGGPENDIRAFQVNGVDSLAGGLFSDRIGFLAVYLPEIAGSRHVAAQTSALEMANVVYSALDAPLPFTLRFGRFEPAYVAFSAKRTFTVAPYDIYDFAGPEGFALADTQDGIELARVFPQGLKLAGGWVNGSGRLDDSDAPRDFYLRASKMLGPGQGQVVGHRVGAFLYSGRARPSDGGSREGFHRLGLDASLNFGQTNVMAQYITGKDDAALNAFNPARDYDLSGGFVEVNHSLPGDIVTFGRLGWVNTPSEQNHDEHGATIGLRYYPAVNVALHAEFSRRRVDRGADNGLSDLTENLFTTRVDFAF